MKNDTVEYRGHHIEIHTDDNPENPRTEWDNFGHMICWHRNYDLTDKDQDKRTPEEMREYFKETHALVLSLYLYDHSGITMRTSPFSCPWDSGQVGYIYALPEEIKKEYKCKQITPTIRRKAFKLLEGEVETFDNYLTGSVYGYVVTETGDSCWGFFGDTKYMIEEAKGGIDYHIKRERTKHIEQVKAWVKNKVNLLCREAGKFGGGSGDRTGHTVTAQQRSDHSDGNTQARR